MRQSRAVRRGDGQGRFPNGDDNISALSLGRRPPQTLGFKPLIFGQNCHSSPRMPPFLWRYLSQ